MALVDDYDFEGNNLRLGLTRSSSSNGVICDEIKADAGKRRQGCDAGRWTTSWS